MVSNQLLNSDFSWLSLEEALHSLCLVLPEQGAALRFPLKLVMLAPRGASGSAPRAEAARTPYRNTALFGDGHLQEHHQHPQTQPPVAGWEPKQAASPPQAGQVLGLLHGAAVLCRRCQLLLASAEHHCSCFPGALPALLPGGRAAGVGAGHCAPRACPGTAPLQPVHCWVWLLPRHPDLISSELWL